MMNKEEYFKNLKVGDILLTKGRTYGYNLYKRDVFTGIEYKRCVVTSATRAYYTVDSIPNYRLRKDKCGTDLYRGTVYAPGLDGAPIVSNTDEFEKNYALYLLYDNAPDGLKEKYLKHMTLEQAAAISQKYADLEEECKNLIAKNSSK